MPLIPTALCSGRFQAGLTGADGPVSVSADGTIYLLTILPSGPGNEPAIIALNSDGTEKWLYIATGGISGRGGPNVGPDGKIYAIVRPENTSSAPNVFALNPNGTLAWNYNEGTYRYGQLGDKDIVFGRTIDQLYFPYESFLRDKRIPQLWAFGLGGDLRFTRRGQWRYGSKSARRFRPHRHASLRAEWRSALGAAVVWVGTDEQSGSRSGRRGALGLQAVQTVDITRRARPAAGAGATARRL